MIAALATLLSLIFVFATLTVYAYFTTRLYVYTNDGGVQVAKVGMQLQLLFDKLGSNVAPGTDLKIPYYYTENSVLKYSGEVTATYDSEAPWGSAKNPYVISETRHLQNLSALQSIGYFDLMYLGNNFNGTDYTEGSASIPYFLICTTSGAPVVIGGTATEEIEIKPIGSAEHPFIGVIGGAFAGGSVTVGEKTSSVSAIHNVKVQTNIDQTDVGLFGYIGYLGEEYQTTTDESSGTTTTTLKTSFEGVAASVRNLLISDVQVIVKEPSVLEKISQLIEHVFQNHKFTDKGDTTNTGIPHENHHIGIFAGHVSYAEIKNISVYYSNQNICAIDLTHITNNSKSTKYETPNYHSTTGIIGFMHNMNAEVNNQTNANCLVTVGGISSDSVMVTPGGDGGGGVKIGLGRGYVMARTLYDGCNNYVQENEWINRVWRYSLDAGATWNNFAMMFFQDASSTSTNRKYVDQNGKEVTISNGVATVNGISYNKYILRNILSGDGDTVPYEYEYKLHDGTTLTERYLQEVSQKIWQIALEEPTDNNTPFDSKAISAIMLYETGVGTGTYHLMDTTYIEIVVVDGEEVQKDRPLAGAQVTNIVQNSDGKTYSADIVGSKVYSANADQLVHIPCVMFYRLQSDGSYVCSTTPTGDIQAPYAFREKPLEIAYAKTIYGTDLCIESREGLNLTGNQEGNFFFYDGVFTFALSSNKDTIEATWENSTPDKIVLGDNDSSKWEQGAFKKNYSVIAKLTKITSWDEWKAIDAETPLLIGYYQGTGDVDTLSTISLYDSPVVSDGFFNEDNRFTLTATTNTFLTDDEIADLEDESGKNFDGFQILNLGSANNLEILKQRFQINAEVSQDGTSSVFKIHGDSASNRLGLLIRTHSWTGSRYNIWCGIEAPGKEDSIFGSYYSYEFRTQATISMVENTEYFRIMYQGGNNWYINYSSGQFNGASANNVENTSNLCIYIVEGFEIVPIGSATYNPVVGSTNISKPADQYVLWPTAIMTQNGTVVDGVTLSGNGYHNATVQKSDGNATTRDIYRTYKLYNLTDLYQGTGGAFQDSKGNPLDKEDLAKKFTMTEPIKYGMDLVIGGTNVKLDNSSVLAPVGVGGASANIPKGSIAFRINKTGESKICVIVSVPVSQFVDNPDETPGQKDNPSLSTLVDYYLGVWKTEDISSGGGIRLPTFNQSTAIQKFELPRSRPYSLESTADGSDYILVEYTDPETKEVGTYRCYLNGERVLVAYQFTVSEAGTYILGTATGLTENSLFGGGTDTSVDYPMEIVYCSADGTASKGSDGTAGSVIGAIDYVYDNNGTIVNVRDYPSTTQVPDGDYSYYFNSRCLTHTDNKASGFPNVNNLQIFVRRSIVDGKSTLTLHVNSSDEAKAKLFQCQTRGVETDKVNISFGVRSAS